MTIENSINTQRITFYKETNLKQTEIGKIPKDWEVKKLGDSDLAYIRDSRKMNYNNKMSKVAVIPMELIPDNGIYAVYQIKELNDVKSYVYCEAGDLLLAKITPSLENGKQGIVPDDVPNGFALATTEVYPIVCKNFDKLFLFYILKHPKYRKILEYSMRGTTGRQRVPKEAVLGLEIPVPSLVEQRGIASVLSFVDDYLALLDQYIAKLEKLKKGLMQRLLTRGIGHKEYKQTPIGKIPKDWRVEGLESVIVDMHYGLTAKAVDKSTGIRMLRTTDIKDYRVNWNSLPYCEITDNRADVNKYIIKKGDLIVARAGTTGISVLVDKDNLNDVIFGSYLIRIKFNNEVLPEFAHYFFQSAHYWNHINSLQAGSTLKNISLPILRTLNIPVPSLVEQRHIADILSSADNKIQIVKDYKDKLIKIKQFLLDTLLTGKVRIRNV